MSVLHGLCSASGWGRKERADRYSGRNIGWTITSIEDSFTIDEPVNRLLTIPSALAVRCQNAQEYPVQLGKNHG